MPLLLGPKLASRQLPFLKAVMGSTAAALRVGFDLRNLIGIVTLACALVIGANGALNTLSRDHCLPCVGPGTAATIGPVFHDFTWELRHEEAPPADG
jgi:hypothetical protein